jgi:hypothetical protein
MIKTITFDDEYRDILAELLLGPDFPWYYNASTNYVTGLDELENTIIIDDKVKESSQFTHKFVYADSANSDHAHYLQEALDVIQTEIGKIKRIKRIKSNLLLKEADYPTDYYHPIHVDNHGDIAKNDWTFLYYVNDSDGDTIIYNEHWADDWKQSGKPLTIQDRVTPKGGTGILFKSTQYHTSCPPILSNRRAVINFIFEMEDETNDTKF